jgi:hypothetical protein
MQSISGRASWLNSPEELRAWIIALDLKAETRDLLSRGRHTGGSGRVATVLREIDAFPASRPWWRRLADFLTSDSAGALRRRRWR